MGKIGEQLIWYYNQGFNLIPVPKGQKGAIISWKQYEETKAPKIPDNYEGNIAVILGKTSGNLIDIDCDTKELFDLMQNILPETMTTQSFRGGHLYFKTDYPIRKFTLDLPKYGKLEVSGQGQISILPPSLHAKGVTYKFIRKIPPAHWHGDVKQELIELIETSLKIKLKRERINIKRILQGVGEGERDDSAIKLATWWRKEGLTQQETLEKMLEWNQNNKPPLEDGVIEIKVESAFKPEKPYAYKFTKKTRKKSQQEFSVGGILEDGRIYEQIANGKFAVTSNGEVKYVDKIGEKIPYEKIPWKLPTEVADYLNEKELYENVKTCIYEHLDHPDSATYDILAGWVISTWVLELWKSVPYLQFYGPFESGKTRALEILSALSHRGWLALYTTPANLYRPLEEWHVTLFLDEAEVYGGKNEILALLNAGYRRGQYVPRQVEDKRRGGFRTEFFNVFGLKALGSTKTFARTLVSRCITFKMSKATRKVKLFIDEESTQKLRNQLLAFRFRTLRNIKDLKDLRLKKGLSTPIYFATTSFIENNNKGKQTMIEKKKEYTIEELAEELGSPRLAELFYPLVTVAPTQVAVDSMLGYAKRMQRGRLSELSLSEEAKVLSAILCCHDCGEIHNGKIKVNDVKNVFNETIDDPNEFRTSQHIGRLISGMGFDRCKVLNGYAGLYWNQQLIDRLASDLRYRECFIDREARVKLHEENKKVKNVFR